MTQGKLAALVFETLNKLLPTCFKQKEKQDRFMNSRDILAVKSVYAIKNFRMVRQILIILI